jgi:hypothetical protein
MQPPRRYSVTPLPSWATRPGGREPSVVEMLTAIFGRRRKSMREMFAQAREIDALTEGMASGPDGELDSSLLSLAGQHRRRRKA